MTCVIGIYFNHFTINDHLFKVYVYCLIKNKLVTHKQTLKIQVLSLALVHSKRALSLECLRLILQDWTFSRQNGTLTHNSAFITVYTGRHINEPSSQGLASDIRQHCCPAHILDLINLRLIYLLLAQNVNNETLKVKLKSIVQEGCPSIVLAPCYANQYAETESVTIV